MVAVLEVCGLKERLDAFYGGAEELVYAAQTEVDGRGGMDYCVNTLDCFIESARDCDIGNDDVLKSTGACVW